MKMYLIKVENNEFLTASEITAKKARACWSIWGKVEIYEYNVKTQGKNFHTLALRKKI